MNPKGELYMRANNLTLLTDLYELTMMQGYFKNPTNQTGDYPCHGKTDMFRKRQQEQIKHHQ